MASGFSFRFAALRGGFFDSKKILSDVERAKVKVASRFGAFARRRMQTSIRYRKQVSAPGSPPSAHRGEAFTREKRNRKNGVVTRQAVSPLRELIFFALDPTTDSVVIGPVVFGAGGAHALEYGGETTSRRGGQVKTTHLSAHPFARPAGAAEAERLPDLLRKMVN